MTFPTALTPPPTAWIPGSAPRVTPSSPTSWQPRFPGRRECDTRRRGTREISWEGRGFHLEQAPKERQLLPAPSWHTHGAGARHIPTFPHSHPGPTGWRQKGASLGLRCDVIPQGWSHRWAPGSRQTLPSPGQIQDSSLPPPFQHGDPESLLLLAQNWTGSARSGNSVSPHSQHGHCPSAQPQAAHPNFPKSLPPSSRAFPLSQFPCTGAKSKSPPGIHVASPEISFAP